jgi:hypothetical protein
MKLLELQNIFLRRGVRTFDWGLFETTKPESQQETFHSTIPAEH